MTMNDATAAGESLAAPSAPILITGAAGFIGSRLVATLLEKGYVNLRCFVRRSSETQSLHALAERYRDARLDLIRGNLLSRDDCAAACRDVAVIFHLAAARGEKSFPDAYMNSVVTTRNLLDASLARTRLRRFVNVSSFSVYANADNRRRILDESCPLEAHPERRGDAYCFAKVKQDEIVMDYGCLYGVPYVIVRPGYVYGPRHTAITGRVGIGTFGVFLHLGGANPVPLTYVDNCADAIVLAGLKPGVDGEIFNIVDDELLTSRRFLRLYKQRVRPFRSIYVPHALSYALCSAWERYSRWSWGQLPPAFNRRTWHAYWRRTAYTNAKAKARLGWRPRVTTAEALSRYFESCRAAVRHA
jgi:nucleoside-diphosphate-sugar epimerase